MDTDATPEDVRYIVQALQPQMVVEANGAGPVSPYDEESLLKAREALMTEYNQLDDMFGVMSDEGFNAQSRNHIWSASKSDLWIDRKRGSVVAQFSSGQLMFSVRCRWFA